MKLSKWKPIPGDEPIMYIDSQTSRQESVQKHFYQHRDPLMHDAWNKKKKHKQIDNTTKRTKKSQQLQLTGFFSLHSQI